MGWYRNWFGTRYYKLLYGHRDGEEAEIWVDAVLARWKLAPGSSVLDLACGRGRHTRCFAARGMDATGIDISAESIAEARASVPEAHFEVHDMRRPYARERFHGVCCLFTSLGYNADLQDDRLVFLAAAEALLPGGRFVLDFMNTQRVLAQLQLEEERTIDGIRFHIRRSHEEGAVVKRIKVIDGVKESHFMERVQALYPDQLEAMALEAGFEVESRTGGPGLMAFDPEGSERFVLWLRKPL